MPRHNPNKKITVTVDADAHAKVIRLLNDPVTGRTRYGGMSDLISRLLIDWSLKELKAREGN